MDQPNDAIPRPAGGLGRSSPLDALLRKVIRLIEFVAVLLLAADVVVLLWSVIARYLLNDAAVWAEELASVLFLWLSMLGAVIALARAEHMALSTIVDLLPASWRPGLRATALALSGLFLALMIVPAYQYFEHQVEVTTPVLGLSEGVRIAAILIGCALMLIVTLARFAHAITLPQLMTIIVLAVAACVALWFMRPMLAAAGYYSLILFFVVLVSACVGIGMPIGFAFGLGTLAYLLCATRVPISVVIGRMDEGMSHLILLGVPLFVLLGAFLQLSGMARAMVDFLAALIGHFRGGLSYVLLAAMYLVSGISGSKAADMAAVAPVLFPEMKKRGSDPGELVALLAASGAMSETIPPSLVLITVGSVTGISIAALFEGGLLPALVLAIALAVVSYFRSGSEEHRTSGRLDWRAIIRLFAIALPALALPFIIRAFVIEGITTATEVSTIGLAYVIVVGAIVHRQFDWRRVYPMMVACASLTGAIMIIIGTATAMAWALTQSGFSADLAKFMTQMPGGASGFMAISIVVFIVLGSVLEGIPAIVLFGPLLFPIARSLHIDPVHYAMVVVLAMGVGLFCPPFGVGYYAACAIGQVHPSLGMRRIWPYIGALIVGLIVVACVPWLSMSFR